MTFIGDASSKDSLVGYSWDINVEYECEILVRSQWLQRVNSPRVTWAALMFHMLPYLIILILFASFYVFPSWNERKGESLRSWCQIHLSPAHFGDVDASHRTWLGQAQIAFLSEARLQQKVPPGFRRWRFPARHGGTPKYRWMVYSGKSSEHGWFGGTPSLGNLHLWLGAEVSLWQRFAEGWRLLAFCWWSFYRTSRTVAPHHGYRSNPTVSWVNIPKSREKPNSLELPCWKTHMKPL